MYLTSAYSPSLSQALGSIPSTTRPLTNHYASPDTWNTGRGKIPYKHLSFCLNLNLKAPNLLLTQITE